MSSPGIGGGYVCRQNSHPSYGSSSLSLSLSLSYSTYSTTDDNGDASSAASSHSTAEAEEPTVIHELAATESLAKEEESGISSISNDGNAAPSILSAFDFDDDAASPSQSPASTGLQRAAYIQFSQLTIYHLHRPTSTCH